MKYFGQLPTLLFLLAALLLTPRLGQGDVGGIQGMTPAPNQLGPNLLSNAGFETGDFTSWNTNCAGSLTIDSTVSHSGNYSAKDVNCSNNILMSQTITVPSHEAMLVTFWVKTDASFAGTIDVTNSDVTHGTIPAPTSNYRLMTVGANSDWVQVQAVFYLNQAYHGGETWRVNIYVSMTAGTIWFDDFSVTDYWYPLRTFLKYPNYRGYLWDDKPRTVSGVSEINPPPGLTASSLEVLVDTAAGCPNNNPLGLNQTINAPSSVQTWAFDGGSLADANSYYICTRATWSDSTTVSYNDWKIVKLAASTRDNSSTGFVNWFDSDGAWVHNGARRLAFGTYDRLSGAYRCNTCLFASKSSYQTGINSLGNWSPKATTANDSQGLHNAAVVADYRANRLNLIMSDITGVGCCVEPQASVGDQLSPWLQALADYNIAHAQLLNNWYGTLVSQVSCLSPCGNSLTAGVPPPPTITASSSGGTIGPNLWVFAEVSGVADQVTHNTADIVTTFPSTAASVEVSGGNTNSVTVTLPSCPSSRWLGYYLYLATNPVSAPPAGVAFQQQGGPLWYPCGAPITLGNVMTTGINPPTADTTALGRLVDPQTDPILWTAIAADMSRTAGLASGNAPVGAGAFYVVDEPNLLGAYAAYYQSQTLKTVANDVPIWGVVDDALAGGWREVLDVMGQDPYGYGITGGSDQATTGTINRRCIVFTGTNNATGWIDYCNPQLIDLATDTQQRLVYGSRPTWTVVQLFQQGLAYSLTYSEMRRQYYKALMGCQNWGNLGCGVLTWGWVDQVGMETQYYEWKNTKAYLENWYAENELMGIQNVWLTPVSDSAQLSGGTGQVDGANGETVTNGKIVSNIKIDHPVASVCAFPHSPGGPSAIVYTNSSTWPFGPVRFITKQMPNGDQWIFANDLCGWEVEDAAVPFNVTFTLVNPPNSVVELYGQDDPGHARTFNITSNQFTDTWTDDQDVHVYVIRKP